MFRCQHPVGQRQSARWGNIRTVQRVGEIDVETVLKHGPFTFECLRQPQMRNRIGTNENLKAVHVTCHLCSTCRHGPCPVASTHLGEAVLHRCDWIGACTDGWVEEHHAVVGKASHLAEAGFEKLADETDLKLHHSTRSVINPVILA